jgi:hypothetical protein
MTGSSCLPSEPLKAVLFIMERPKILKCILGLEIGVLSLHTKNCVTQVTWKRSQEVSKSEPV